MSLVDELQQLITAPILNTQAGKLAQLADGEGVPASANEMIQLISAKADGLERALLRLASIVDAQQQP